MFNENKKSLTSKVLNAGKVRFEYYLSLSLYLSWFSSSVFGFDLDYACVVHVCDQMIIMWKQIFFQAFVFMRL